MYDNSANNKNVRETNELERQASDKSLAELPMLSVIKSRNPYAKDILVVQDPYMDKNTMIRCPTCGVPNDLMDEPHQDPKLRTQAFMDTLNAHWDACPWPHPKLLKDEHGNFVTEEHVMLDPHGIPYPNCEPINNIKQDIDYPDEHPYWICMDEHDKLASGLSCPGPKYSSACREWIGKAEGPESHEKCDEECYCDCHYAKCICPNLDKGVDATALAIVCSIHGHVYTKVTTRGL